MAVDLVNKLIEVFERRNTFKENSIQNGIDVARKGMEANKPILSLTSNNLKNNLKNDLQKAESLKLKFNIDNVKKSIEKQNKTIAASANSLKTLYKKLYPQSKILEKAHTNAGEDVDNAEKNVKSKQIEVQSLKEAKQKNHFEIVNLVITQHSTNTKLKSVCESIDKQTKEIKKAQDEQGKCDKEIKQKEKEIKKAQDEQKKFEGAVKSLKLEPGKKLKDVLTSKRAGYTDLSNQAKQTFKIIIQQKEELEMFRSTQNKFIKEEHKKIKEIKQKIKQKDVQIEVQEAIIDPSKRGIWTVAYVKVTSISKSDDESYVVRDAIFLHKKLNNEKRTLEEEVSDLNGKITKIQEKINTKAKAFENLKDSKLFDVKGLENQLENLKNKKKEIETEKNNFNNQLNSFTEQKNELEKTIEDTKSKVTDLKPEITKLNNKIEEEKTKLEDAKKTLRKSELVFKKTGEDLEQYKEKITKQVESIKEKSKNQISAAKKEIKRLEKERKILTDTFANLSTAIINPNQEDTYVDIINKTIRQSEYLINFRIHDELSRTMDTLFGL